MEFEETVFGDDLCLSFQIRPRAGDRTRPWRRSRLLPWR